MMTRLAEKMPATEYVVNAFPFDSPGYNATVSAVPAVSYSGDSLVRLMSVSGSGNT